MLPFFPFFTILSSQKEKVCFANTDDDHSGCFCGASGSVTEDDEGDIIEYVYLKSFY